MKAREKFTQEIIDKLRDAIQDVRGNEILFICYIGKEGLISEVRVASRGNEKAVPALEPFLERGDVVVHNHPSGVLRPSEPDLGIASRLGNQGIGFFIIDNEVSNVYAVAEPVLIEGLEEIDADELSKSLLPGGALERLSDYYETRDSQVEMLGAVAGSFNNESFFVAEAGTGVGKSFAYLLPAFAWTEKNKERVIISTATINLQQQLIDKDIPMVKSMLGSQIKAVLVKGRSNYLCRKRLAEALEENTLFSEEDEDLSAILEWSKSTETGSISELSFFPEKNLWSRICSEADTCAGLRCSYREDCFIIRARRKAAAAQILVANHHLLFSDLALRKEGLGYERAAVLPPFKRIIFDEAHNIERSASSYFSVQLSKLAIYKSLARLYRRKKNKRLGLLPALRVLGADETTVSAAIRLLSPLRSQAEATEASVLGLLSGSSNLRMSESIDEVIRTEIIKSLKELQGPLLKLVEKLYDCLSSLSEEEAEAPPAHETEVIMNRLNTAAALCEEFSRFDEYPEKVYWIEKSRLSDGGQLVNFNGTPLDISKVMKEAVYERYKTIVFTSATLTVNKNFNYWKRRVGLLGEERLEERIFPSPFPYRTNVLLAVPEDAPQPQEDEYIPFVSDLIGEVLEISEGRGLILFTAYSMLREVYDRIKNRLVANKINVFRQGEDERSRLLSNFNLDTTSVLFATNSFWEGVDTPGDSLRVVVICRLPFSVPTDPVLNARMELIRKRGGNPFWELSLPEAIMRFRQGFGRLMRRTTDHGVVIITDPRIISRNYGKIFLSSLPDTAQSIKLKDSLILEIENFLYTNGT